MTIKATTLFGRLTLNTWRQRKFSLTGSNLGRVERCYCRVLMRWEEDEGIKITRRWVMKRGARDRKERFRIKYWLNWHAPGRVRRILVNIMLGRELKWEKVFHQVACLMKIFLDTFCRTIFWSFQACVKFNSSLYFFDAHSRRTSHSALIEKACC